MRFTAALPPAWVKCTRTKDVRLQKNKTTPMESAAAQRYFTKRIPFTLDYMRGKYTYCPCSFFLRHGLRGYSSFRQPFSSKAPICL